MGNNNIISPKMVIVIYFILAGDNNNMKNTKTIKTILFASLIAAMILPFSVMGMANAAPNENANNNVKKEIPEGYEITPFGLWKSEDIKEWDGVTKIDTEKIIKEWKDKHPGEKSPAEIAIEKMQKKSEDNVPSANENVWNVYGKILYSTEPSSFVAYWNVPNAPASYTGGTAIFYFNAFQSGTDVIVQPVLQFGDSAACSSASWKIASWILVASTTYKTTCADASPGNVIKGQIAVSNDYWNVQITNQSTGTSKSLIAYVSQAMNKAFVTLETANITQQTCSTVPNDVYFSNMLINGATPPNWTKVQRTIWCGMDFVSSSGSSAYINTNN